MAEDTALSTESTETTTIQTGADQKTITDLNAAFEDFWKDEDATDAPAAPGDNGAAQETKSKPAKASEAPAAPEAKEEKPKEEFNDEDIDKLELSPHARSEAAEDFRKVRDLWKADRVKLREASDTARKLQAQLEEARQNSLSDEQKADYEQASAVRRRVDIASDPSFVAQYQTPINNQYRTVFERAVQVLDDKEGAMRWAQHMLEKWSPDQLNSAYWEEKVLSQVPDGTVGKQKLLAAIEKLEELQETRNEELNKHAANRDTFQQWNADTAKRVQQEIMAEIAEQEKRIKDYLPRNIEDAKNDSERQAIQAHNERFAKLNDHFKGILQEIGQKGPKGWVRAGIEATKAVILEEEYKTLEADYKAVSAERDKFKAELDKIAGVRRKLSNTSGTPPSTGQKKDGGLTIKDLDVRRAFEKFDWGE